MTILDELKILIGQHGSDAAQPLLDDTKLTEILAQCQTRDSNSLWVGDALYVPTYDLHRAAAKAFRAKAAIVATDVDINIEGRGIYRSQMAKQLLELAKTHAALARPTSFRLENS